MKKFLMIIIAVLMLGCFSIANAEYYSIGSAEFSDEIGNFTVLAFAEKASSDISGVTRSGGRSAQRTEFDPVYIEILLNDQIPSLLVGCADGTVIRTVLITFDLGYSVELSNVIISSFDWSETPDKSTLGIGLNYGKIKWTYGGNAAGWDLEANKPLFYESSEE